MRTFISAAVACGLALAGRAPPRAFLGAFLGAVLGAAPAAAEVLQQSPNGFVIRHTALIQAPPETVFRTLGEVGGWWSPAHTHGGDAANLSLDLAVDGCFCEARGDAAPFEHGRVAVADPARMLALRAPLGPLHGVATRADLVFHWRQAEGGWALEMIYVVRGPETGALAAAVDGVLGEQFARLTARLDAAAPASARTAEQ